MDEGGKLFAGYCASCHGPRAEGTEQWKKPDAQGMYPPPPLNGTGLAWHHSHPQLLQTIRESTQGNMPGWQTLLSDAQISSVIAHFQSYWPDWGYQLWTLLSDAQISSVIAHFQSYWPDWGYQLWLARHER